MCYSVQSQDTRFTRNRDCSIFGQANLRISKYFSKGHIYWDIKKEMGGCGGGTTSSFVNLFNPKPLQLRFISQILTQPLLLSLNAHTDERAGIKKKMKISINSTKPTRHCQLQAVLKDKTTHYTNITDLHHYPLDFIKS